MSASSIASILATTLRLLCFRMFAALLALLPFFVIGLSKLDETTSVDIPTDIQEHHLELGIPTYFRILVKRGPDAWVVLRTTGEFETLHDKLSRDEGYALKPLPSGKVEYMVDDEEKTHFRALKEWLQNIVINSFPHSESGDLIESFLDPASGANARISGVAMPPDNFRKCFFKHYFGIHLADHIGGKGVKVFRSFSDFSTLRDELAATDNSMLGVPFPPEDITLDERRRGLEFWLQEVMKSMGNRNMREESLRIFLDPKLADEAYEARANSVVSPFFLLPFPSVGKHFLKAIVKMY